MNTLSLLYLCILRLCVYEIVCSYLFVVCIYGEWVESVVPPTYSPVVPFNMTLFNKLWLYHLLSYLTLKLFIPLPHNLFLHWVPFTYYPLTEEVLFNLFFSWVPHCVHSIRFSKFCLLSLCNPATLVLQAFLLSPYTEVPLITE